ncbi:ferredoxin reductase family protein [Actinoallomurus oryzae]|uniref:Ferredoxin reductase family protein n=1 Tax=Actinoallomurus oryzae TaxID=502180 RepID=A0ABP8QLB2_9ACTN
MPGGGMLPGPGRLWERVLVTVMIAGAVPVFGVWWQDTPAGSLRGIGDHLVAAGRVSGMLGAYLLLVLVTLMSRMPWLDNRVGSDVIARYHRALGEYTVILLVAHAILLVVGYGLQDGTGPVAETVTVEVSYPDVLMSTAALGLLVMVGVVSARAVRPRLAYGSWHLTHLYVYLAMALAFAHEFANGADFSGSLRNRVLWSAVHIGVFATLVVFRLLVPVWRSVGHSLRVAEVVTEGPGVVSVYMTGRNLNRLKAEAGQFLRWRFLDRGLWWESHPYSLSAPPTDRTIRITVKDLGDGSGRLRQVRPGTRVWFEGPYGAFTAGRGRARRGGRPRSLLIAGGVGITPIRALYETLPGSGSDVILLYRASRNEDLVFWRELVDIARHRGFGLHPIVGGHVRKSRDPLDASALLRLVPDVAQRDVYLCGPPGLVKGATGHLRKAGVPRSRIHVEAFDL